MEAVDEEASEGVAEVVETSEEVAEVVETAEGEADLAEVLVDTIEEDDELVKIKN